MSVNVFNIPSDSSFTIETSALGSSEYSTSSSLSIQGVRITPGSMHFDNAFEGKCYKQKLTIQNCGQKLANVRLFPCNSTMFEYRSFEKGICLSPGMRVVRMVSYMYKSTVGTVRGTTSIWINDEEVMYKFFVTLSTAILEIEPRVIDFGKMDAVNHASTRTFRLRNNGYRATNFAIDLGRNPLELNVLPIRGTLHAKSTIIVIIEIVGTEGGDFCEEIWIKTNPPQRIIVKGSFVTPKFLVRKFTSSLDFKFVDFPPTYYGSGSVQMMLVENDSPSSSMFCVMAEIKNVTMTLEEAQKLDVSYQCFHISPMEGRIQAQKGALLQITFQPIKTFPRDRNYAVCFLKIIRMDCQDIHDPSIYDDRKLPSSVYFEETFSTPTEDLNPSSLNTFMQDSLYEEQFSFEHSIKLCVHGEKEVAGVDLTPNIIHLDDLTLGHEYKRTLLVKNKSQKLPIKVKYNKMGGIAAIPAEFEVRPGGSFEVLIVIHAIRFGEVRKKITFDLVSLFKTLGKNMSGKVGSVELDIYLEVSKFVKKTAINQCTELPEKLTPELPYCLNDEELAKKMRHNDYYLNYMRSLKKTSPREGKFEDYGVTDKKIVKCQKLVTRHIPRVYKNEFIPLLPSLLYYVKITPKSIRLRDLTANSAVNRFFEIHNMNPFPIRAFVKPSKNNIIVESNGRYVIKAGEKKKINFLFVTTVIGRYYGNISVLINDSTFYEVTTVAHVFSKTIGLDVDKIVFKESGPRYKFIKLTNPSTCAVHFAWELSFGCFQIYPQKGTIRPDKSVFCTVSCNPIATDVYNAECLLKSENGQSKTVMLSYKKEDPSVSFETHDVDMSPIPLNLPKKRKLIMRNLKNCHVSFRVVNPVPLPGITVEPICGNLIGMDDQVFLITVQIKAVIEFCTRIVFVVDEKLELAVSLRGTVEFPNIRLTPRSIQFRKVAPYSFDIQAFRIQNLTESDCLVTFPIHELPEFTITPSDKDPYPHQERLLLRGRESKLMYVHFQPRYTCTYAVFLGYVTNDILGPARMSSPDSDTTMFSLEANTKIYYKYSNVKIGYMPETLKSVSINCKTVERSIKIPNLMIDFVYFGEGHYNNVTQRDFVITNVSEKVVSVCIRTDNLGCSCFTLVPRNDNCEVFNVSYKIDIEPGAKAVFDVGFYPQDTGEYTLQLPIFLRHYFNNRIFNYLSLKGLYKTPTISVSPERVHFEPVPRKLANKISLSVKMENHFENCKFSLNAGLTYVTLVVNSEVHKEHGVTLLDVDVICTCEDTKCLDTNMILKCSCDSTCSVPITGVVENCLLTTHVISHFLHIGIPTINISIDDSPSLDELPTPRSKPWWFFFCHSRHIPVLSMNTNITTYPSFPADDDRTDYAKYMRRLQKTLESWLFSQGFYQKRYHKIPEGFTELYKPEEDRPHKSVFLSKTIKPTRLPLFELVANFVGRKIKEVDEPEVDTSDRFGWFSYTCRMYSQILQFLRSFPVFSPHVESKFLLNYDHYLIYEKVKRPNKTPLDESTFQLLSKQSWIDLILQIIKTFVLFRAVPDITRIRPRPSEDRPRPSEDRPDHFSFTSYPDAGIDVLETGIYGAHEMYLLYWLEELYNSEKKDLWGNSPKEIEVVYFDQDLRNGLVLGAVTAHYCPYLKTKIQEMYSDPQNAEEYHHNACVLVQTWSMLHLSYDVKPSHILDGDMLAMLLLVVYLYNVLPNLLPKEKITIEAKLTQKSSKCIDIQNKGEYSIFYKVIFFHNEDKQFSVPNHEIKVEPYETKTVKVNYYARRVKPETVTLLLSGETPGHKYGRSIVITVEGLPDVSFVTTEINVTVDLYKLCRISIPIQAPVKKKIVCKLLISFHPEGQECVLYPHERTTTFGKVCELLFDEESFCEFDEEGLWTSRAIACVRQVGPRIVWIYFTNYEVGDFGVKIILTGQPNDACYEDIDVWVPENHKSLECRCKPDEPFDQNCPRVIQTELPKMNSRRWNARKAMLLQQITEKESQFWSTRLYSQIGTRVLRLIMSTEQHPVHEALDEDMEYTTEIQPPTCLLTVPKVFVDDVISDDVVTLPIHPIKKNPMNLKKSVLRLISRRATEVRFYKLNFKHRKGEVDIGK